MSIRLRYIIDSFKRSVQGYLKLPVPDYGNPSYWEHCYKSLGPNDVMEWGNIFYHDLAKYQYTPVEYDPLRIKNTTKTVPSTQSIATTLGETLGVYPKGIEDEPVLYVGCGNSKLGEDMVEAGYKGPIIQVDIASRVIESMSQRGSLYQQKGDLAYIQDDATILSAFDDNTIAAAFDKGLVDALFCADETTQCRDIMTAVHRVLKPGGVFCVFSRSSPEFVMETILPYKQNHSSWQNIQIRLLDYVILYRFQKAAVPKLQRRRPR